MGTSRSSCHSPRRGEIRSCSDCVICIGPVGVVSSSARQMTPIKVWNRNDRDLDLMQAGSAPFPGSIARNTMNTPTLSVLMPNYNHAHYLPTSVGAILAQSYQPMEILILDDGSTDGSYSILEEFARLEPRIRLSRNERNMGAN